MTNHPNSSNTARPQVTKKQDGLIWISLLIGLIGLVGLICRQGTIPVQAAGAQPPALTKTAPAAPLNSVQAQATITPLDVVVLFDVSGSAEDQTTCHDCWVRTSYNITSTPYPNNGYFNPLPYDPNLAPGAANQSIPLSRLCTDPSTPWLQNNGGTIYKYLTLEAELYSANQGDWDLNTRTPGEGFWAIQRGSHGSQFPAGFEGAANEAAYNQGNQAGQPNFQSSNVCNPATAGGINCTVNIVDNVCNDDPGNDIVRDCSAYIAARPFQNYAQTAGSLPYVNGASYNLDCFKSGSGPFTDTVLSHACWSNTRTSDNPFVAVTGSGPSNVPWVEYDFTPTWTQTTYLWIRAIGGNRQSYTWAGPNPDSLDATPTNNLTAWRKVIFWQIDQGQVDIQNDNANTAVQVFDLADFRDNRAVADSWRWIRLGPVSTTALISGTQHTLKIYQGSAGYKIDKIIFTNDANGTTGSPPPAMRRNLSGLTEVSDSRLAFGPPASFGSATREACNVCNPSYGNTVDPSQCSCLQNNAEASQRYIPTYPGYDPSFYGSGTACSTVVSPTNQLQAQLQTGLYSGIQPLRSTQEAIKIFASQLDPLYDQLGLIAFSSAVDNSSRAKLQCLRTLNPAPADAATCYAGVLRAVERQWATAGTDISEGLRESLEELGFSVGSNTGVDSSCTGIANDKHACDRSGAARRVIILVTDGMPNDSVSNCGAQSGYADYWAGLTGSNDPDFDCAMWYAEQAAAKGVTLYTIGLGGGANADFLTTMATGIDPRSGGTPVPMFNAQCGQYLPVANPTDLETAFDTILAQARNCILNMPVLSLTKSDNVDQIVLGQVLSYTLSVANSGGVTATNVLITDTLDSSVSFASASDSGTFTAGVVTWNVGDVPPLQTITRTLTVTVENVGGSGILTNTAWLASAEGAGQSSTMTTTVVNGERISSTSGYNVLQNQSLIVYLENHLSQSGPYNIYLGTYRLLCPPPVSAVHTGIQNKGFFECLVDASIPPGFYELFSTRQDQYPSRLATAPELVEVVADTIIPPMNLVIGGPTSGITNTVYTFTASVNPLTTTLPLTYAWQASDQTPLTHLSGLSDTITFTWNTPGFQLITATVTNAAGAITATHNIALGICQDPLQNKSFETTSIWGLASGEGVVFGSGGHTGNQQLLADSFSGTYRKPYFYQQFIMPSLAVSSTTHLKLSLFTMINNLNDGDDPNDRYYAIVTTGPNLASTHITNPVEIVNGVAGSAPNTFTDWLPVNVLLLPANGINLEDYVGQSLYLYIYNNGNTTTATCPFPGCHKSKFSFDDVSLDICSLDAPVLTLAVPGLPASIAPGQVLTYTLAAVNDGSADATGVVLTDVLDNKANFVSASDGGQHQSGLVTWNIGSLRLGQILTRTLQVTISSSPNSSILTNTIHISSTEGMSGTNISTINLLTTPTPITHSTYLPVILK